MTGDMRDVGLILGSGRSPGKGNGNPLQYSSLGNPMDRSAWWATVHRITKGQTWLKWLNTYVCTTVRLTPILRRVLNTHCVKFSFNKQSPSAHSIPELDECFLVWKAWPSCVARKAGTQSMDANWISWAVEEGDICSLVGGESQKSLYGRDDFCSGPKQ